MSRCVRRLCVQLALAHVVRAWLSSAAGHIVYEGTHEPVRLRCVNWYGAHMETFVAGGLDKRSCGAIADRIVAIGANCVRIPLSVQLVLEDPSPPAAAVAGLDPSECNASTALTVLDCQVRALTRRGLMVVLNSHTSVAGWVGAGERAPQGLWHSARFPTRDWVASLAALAVRYRTDPLVVGLDIRNEVHDQGGVVVTWGESADPRSDWRAATVLADAAIRRANPHLLVIVSGLARSYDLRAMQDLRNYRSKYVFTTHVYTFSWWFTRVNWTLVLCLSLLFIAGNLAALRWLYKQQHVVFPYATEHRLAPAAPYVLAGAVLLPTYAAVVSLAWIQLASQEGCSSIARDAEPTLGCAAAGLAVVAVACCCLTTENRLSWGRLLMCFCLWNTLLGAVQAALSVFYRTYWAVLWDLRRWHSSDIPVWVGEFGTVVGDASVEWGWLLAYVREMDYAYWPLNGCATRFDEFGNDTYGLLDCDWATIRDAAWTRTVFPPPALQKN